MKDYKHLKREALQILDARLSKKLHYHGLKHTLDVLEVCNQYIEREEMALEEANLLRIGALLHDIGFTVSNNHHEEHSVELAGPMMEKYGYNTADIELVKGLIRSTRLPQTPNTHLEQIICDADLDYLGRDDFYAISDQLFKELKSFSRIQDKEEWNRQQIQFLESHTYHTDFAKRYRQPKKEARILELKAMLDPGLSSG